MSGYIIALVAKPMPGLQQVIHSYSRPDVELEKINREQKPPVPFTILYALKVSDVAEKIKALYRCLTLNHKYSVLDNNYYRITLEQLTSLCDLMGGKVWSKEEDDEAESEADSEANSEADSEADSEANREADSEADSEANSEADEEIDEESEEEEETADNNAEEEKKRGGGCGSGNGRSRTMYPKYFKNGQKIRHKKSNGDIWKAVYVYETNTFNRDNVEHRTLSGFALAHHRACGSLRTSCDGWIECEYKTKKGWISTNTLGNSV